MPAELLNAVASVCQFSGGKILLALSALIQAPWPYFADFSPYLVGLLLDSLGFLDVCCVQIPGQTPIEETQQLLLKRLEADGVLERDVAELFHVLRRKGNLANHDLHGDHATALKTLRIAWQLGVWFHRTFAEPAFRSGPFQPPPPPSQDDSAQQPASQDNDQLRQELAELQEAVQNVLAAEEQRQWEQLAEAAEADKAALAAQLLQLQQAANLEGAAAGARLRQAARAATERIELDEAATRQLIDGQLRQAGWEADSQSLRYSKGARPQKHRNLAIAAWPTSSGPADYVLFAGLTPLAAVEAKRANTDVAGKLPQAQRYCHDFQPSPETQLDAGRWEPTGDIRIPFAFSSNGRSYLRQLRTKSGIWFRELRTRTTWPRRWMAGTRPRGSRP